MSKVNKRDQLLSLKQQIFHGISIFFKEFSGNSDSTSVVSHDLIPPIMARYIRFRPLAWHWQIAMRVELYGCHGNRDFCFSKPYQSNQKSIMVSFRSLTFFSKVITCCDSAYNRSFFQNFHYVISIVLFCNQVSRCSIEQI